ncbi:iron ABC transporter ATP-binding protein [Agrobacterium tumefaciens]|uniref:Iron ABC transporter ATP-binding protein n=1 Tax=Agrobacterium tumefaciens TaxID=358 RepID=A0A0D0KJI3_AGRTU|nr:iron ABC transporter ATP-binding protein [Agrobacterium tumefaciens]
MIELENVGVRRGNRTIVSGVSSRLDSGQIHVIIGPNGSGKTTLLRAVFGDIPLDAGTIRLGNHVLSPGSRRRPASWQERVAYMPQDTAADVALTVLEVVLLGRLDKLSLHIGHEILEMAIDRLAQVGIAHLANRDISSLSGGQRQLALFAQVLMREPEIMLLDEPVSALDLKHQVSLLDVLKRQTLANGWITLVVLHDLNLACQYADNLLVIADGSVKASGAPMQIVTPALIRETYGLEVDVLQDRRGNPVIQPLVGLNQTTPKREGISV